MSAVSTRWTECTDNGPASAEETQSPTERNHPRHSASRPGPIDGRVTAPAGCDVTLTAALWEGSVSGVAVTHTAVVIVVARGEKTSGVGLLRSALSVLRGVRDQQSLTEGVVTTLCNHPVTQRERGREMVGGGGGERERERVTERERERERGE